MEAYACAGVALFGQYLNGSKGSGGTGQARETVLQDGVGHD